MALTEQELAEIEQRNRHARGLHGSTWDWAADSEKDRDTLLAEVRRLRGRLKATVEIERIRARLRRAADIGPHRLRLAWESAQRGRRSARLLNAELIRAHRTQVAGLEVERDRLAATVQRVRDLTRSTDGDDLDGDSELPVGLFQGALDGGEPDAS